MKRNHKIMLVLMALVCCTFTLTGCQTQRWQRQYDAGITYLEQENYQNAFDAFSSAIEIDSGKPEAHLGRGKAGLALAYQSFLQDDKLLIPNYLDTAIADCEFVLESGENDTNIYSLLGEMLTAAGRIQDAVDILSEGAAQTDNADLKLALNAVQSFSYDELLLRTLAVALDSNENTQIYSWQFDDMPLSKKPGLYMTAGAGTNLLIGIDGQPTLCAYTDASAAGSTRWVKSQTSEELFLSKDYVSAGYYASILLQWSETGWIERAALREEHTYDIDFGNTECLWNGESVSENEWYARKQAMQLTDVKGSSDCSSLWRQTAPELWKNAWELGYVMYLRENNLLDTWTHGDVNNDGTSELIIILSDNAFTGWDAVSDNGLGSTMNFHPGTITVVVSEDANRIVFEPCPLDSFPDYHSHISVADGAITASQIENTLTWHYTPRSKNESYSHFTLVGDEREIHVVADGKRIYLRQANAYFDPSGTMMTPLQELGEELGLQVSFDPETKTTTLSGTGTTLSRDEYVIEAKIIAGQSTVQITYIPVSGTERSEDTVELSAIPLIQNDCVYAPIRCFSVLFGYEVEWDAKQYIVSITSGAINKPKLPVRPLEDGDYHVTVYGDTITKNADGSETVYCEVDEWITLSDTFVQNLKIGDSIPLSQYGYYDDIIINHIESNEYGLNINGDEIMLEKVSGAWDIYQYDRKMSYISKAAELTIPVNAEITDDLTSASSGHGMKSEKLSSLKAYFDRAPYHKESETVSITIKDGYVTTLTVYYRP